MIDQELIELLRNEDGERQYIREAKIVLQAERSLSADRIEEAVKERDAYLAERNKFQLYLQRTHADLELEVAAVDVLSAKLAKAVEALREILMKPRSIDQTYVELWADTIKEVRAVLDELEGGSEPKQKQSV